MSQRLIQPSMSAAHLVLACGWPWFKPYATEPLQMVQETAPKPKGKYVLIKPSDAPKSTLVASPFDTRETSVEADYGSAVHEVLAARIIAPPRKIDMKALVDKYQVQDEPKFRLHCDEAVHSFIAWARKTNPWGIDLAKRAKIRVEQPIAYNVPQGTARHIAHANSLHQYRDAERDEFPGTADVVFDEIESSNAPDLIVVDHKTGDGWDLPLKNPQLLSLGLANKARIKAKSVALGIFHTPIDTGSSMYADEIGADDLKKFRSELRLAWSRIGDGSLRPGPHCSDCPAVTRCPAHASAITQVEFSLVGMTKERAGEIKARINAFKKAVEALEQEINAFQAVHGDLPLPDGRWASRRPMKRDTVSLKSIRDGFSGIDGAYLATELQELAEQVAKIPAGIMLAEKIVEFLRSHEAVKTTESLTTKYVSG
jgi:hypothetical protein